MTYQVTPRSQDTIFLSSEEKGFFNELVQLPFDLVAKILGEYGAPAMISLAAKRVEVLQGDQGNLDSNQTVTLGPKIFQDVACAREFLESARKYQITAILAQQNHRHLTRHDLDLMNKLYHDRRARTFVGPLTAPAYISKVHKISCRDLSGLQVLEIVNTYPNIKDLEIQKTLSDQVQDRLELLTGIFSVLAQGQVESLLFKGCQFPSLSSQDQFPTSLTKLTIENCEKVQNISICVSQSQIQNLFLLGGGGLADLESFLPIKSLRTFSIQKIMGFSEEMAGAVAKCSELRSLDICVRRGIAYNHSFESLEKASYPFPSLLEKLSLSCDEKSTEYLFNRLQSLLFLQDLTLDSVPGDLLRKLPVSLTSLKAGHVDFDQMPETPIEYPSGLLSLSLSGMGLKYSPNLYPERLSETIHELYLNPDFNFSLENWKQLKSLHASCPPSEEATDEFIRMIPATLRQLFISNPSPSHSFNHFKELEKLSLSATLPIVPSHIPDSPSLTWLCLYRTALSMDVLEKIHQLPLTKLFLFDVVLPSMQSASKVLPEHLTELELWNKDNFDLLASLGVLPQSLETLYLVQTSREEIRKKLLPLIRHLRLRTLKIGYGEDVSSEFLTASL